jgi:hypothetical protein
MQLFNSAGCIDFIHFSFKQNQSLSSRPEKWLSIDAPAFSTPMCRKTTSIRKASDRFWYEPT